MNASSSTNNPSRFWATALLFVGLGFAIWKASAVIVLVLSAIVISIFIESVAEYLTRIGIPRFLAIIIVFTLTLLLIGGMIVTSIPIIIKEISALKPFLPDGDQLEKVLRTFTGGSSASGDGFLAVSPDVVAKLTSSTKDAGQGALRMITGTLGGFANLVLLSMLSLYLALEERAIEKLIRATAPADSELYILSLWRRIKSKTEGWFRGQLVNAFIVMIVTYAGLLLLNVQYALLLALMSGMLGIIPFGIVVAFLPALAIAFSHGKILTPVYVTVLYGMIQYCSDYILQPLLTRKSTGLPPLLVIISMVLSITLFGLLGFLIAIPAALFFLEIAHDRELAKQHLEQTEADGENPVIVFDDVLADDELDQSLDYADSFLSSEKSDILNTE
jgi:predicted PurR-regulated permease PerM